MSKKINFIFGIHNHQPIGNFDFVFEYAVEKSYRPFLEMLLKHPDIKVMVHFSGCLLDWIEEHNPRLLDLLGELNERKQIELMGGGYYEPILTMISENDRLAQIRLMQTYIKNRFKTEAKGIWLTERVWEPYLAKTLAQAGVKFAVIDDYHFKCAGLLDEEINGYFITEEEGFPVSVFPINERLRYLIPFEHPNKTIDYLRGRLREDPDQLVSMLDDGEKYGVWPNTYKLVYQDGWLEQFFKLLESNKDWIQMRLCSDFMKEVPPKKLVHLPNNSYFEMSVWSLPASKAEELEQILKDLEKRGEKVKYQVYIRGGFWRGFLSKYPEANMLQKWMLKISSDLEGILGRGETTKAFMKEAKMHLLKGQCNCPYWHGVFGGLYLPHLRHAVSSELVSAQTQLDKIRFKEKEFLSLEETDLDCDGTNEIIVNTKRLSAVFKPSFGGSVPLLAFKDKAYNLQNTLARRYEHYHSEIWKTQHSQYHSSASIHDLTRTVSDEVKQNLFYDWHHRFSLMDHFFGEGTNLDLINSMKYKEEGDFVNQPYQSKILSTSDEIVITLNRDGYLYRGGEKIPIRIGKNIYIGKTESGLRAVYKICNMWRQPVRISPGIEWNLFLLGGDDEKKSFRFDNTNPISPLVKRAESKKCSELVIADDRIGFHVRLKWNTEADCWVLPIRTVSQSEAGYDFIYQGSVVIPHWDIALQPEEETTIVMTMAFETSS
jgi:hypothetical protein